MRKCIVLFLLLSSTLFCQTHKTRVAVLDILDASLKKEEATALTERLILLLSQTGEFTLLEREMTALILQEQGFQQSGCTAGECAVEVGQILGVQKMISCKVGAVGRYFHSKSFQYLTPRSFVRPLLGGQANRLVMRMSSLI